MKLNWFTRKGIIYLPASAIGWVILVLATAFAIYRFIDINSHSKTLSETLNIFVFNALMIGLVYTIVAYFTEQRPIKTG